MTLASEHQPAPQPGRVNVIDLVERDLRERAETGKVKYGTYLQTHNGRDALWDAYQESLDQAMYLRQLIAERETVDETERLRATIREIAQIQLVFDPEPGYKRIRAILNNEEWLAKSEVNQMEVDSRLQPVEIKREGARLVVALADGRMVGHPLTWYPFLEAATEDQFRHLVASPLGIYWPDLEDGISIEMLILGPNNDNNALKSLSYFRKG